MSRSRRIWSKRSTPGVGRRGHQLLLFAASVGRPPHRTITCVRRALTAALCTLHMLSMGLQALPR